MLSEVQDTIDKVKDKMEPKEEKEAKEKDIELEEETPMPDPVLLEEPFLKAIKAIKRKSWKAFLYLVERWILISSWNRLKEWRTILNVMVSLMLKKSRCQGRG